MNGSIYSIPATFSDQDPVLLLAPTTSLSIPHSLLLACLKTPFPVYSVIQFLVIIDILSVLCLLITCKLLQS